MHYIAACALPHANPSVAALASSGSLPSPLGATLPLCHCCRRRRRRDGLSSQAEPWPKPSAQEAALHEQRSLPCSPSCTSVRRSSLRETACRDRRPPLMRARASGYGSLAAACASRARWRPLLPPPPLAAAVDAIGSLSAIALRARRPCTPPALLPARRARSCESRHAAHSCAARRAARFAPALFFMVSGMCHGTLQNLKWS